MAPGPHPLAGRSGEGPPLAPPNWRWRAGNRISDMYFSSPSGMKFRSRPALASYLETLSDPPDASLFCWKVTEEILKNVPQVGPVPMKQAPKRKAQSPIGGEKKRIKFPSLNDGPQASTSEVQLKEEPVSLTTSVPQTESEVPYSEPLQRPLNMRERRKKRVKISLPRSFKSILAGRSTFKLLYDSETLNRFLDEGQKLNHKTAAEINDMRKVLLERNLEMTNICKYPNSVIRVFVRLLRNEEAPISMGKVELADLCVNWSCKQRNYWCLLESNRIGFRPAKCQKMQGASREGLAQSGETLSFGLGGDVKRGNGNNFYGQDGSGGGNEHRLPSSSGEVNVADLGLPHGSSRVAGEGVRSSEPAAESQQRGTSANVNPTESTSLSASKELEVSVGEPSSNFTSGKVVDASYMGILEHAGNGLLHRVQQAQPEVSPFCPGNNARESEVFEVTAQGKQQMETGPASSILRYGVTDTVSLDKTSLSVDMNATPHEGEVEASGGVAVSLNGGGTVTCFAGDIGRRLDSAEPMSLRQPGVLSGGKPYSDLDGESIIVITGFKSSMSEGIGSENHRVEAGRMNGGASATVGASPAVAKLLGASCQSSDCGCRICSNDSTFCRGCMCSFCRKPVQPRQDGTVIECPVCNHVCHVYCAQAMNTAGVVKELGLDVQLTCPSCSRKVDLLPFFQKSFDLMLSLSFADVDIKDLEKLVLQVTHLLKGTEKTRYRYVEGLLVECHELLRNSSFLSLVQQLLRTIRDEFYTPHDIDAEPGRGSSASPQIMDFLRKEELARESLHAARTERLYLEQVVDKVQKAYENALDRREEARNALASMTSIRTSREPELSREQTNSPATQELLRLRQAEVDREMQKLWGMRNFDSKGVTSFSGLDSSSKAWLESLNAQRMVVGSAQAALEDLQKQVGHVI